MVDEGKGNLQWERDIPSAALANLENLAKTDFKADNDSEQKENGAPAPVFVENNGYQGAKGILSDPEKEKKIRKLNDKIASIQKIKQAHAEGKPLEKNQIDKLSKEKELMA